MAHNKENRNACRDFVGKPKQKDPLKDLGINDKLMLK
jgi:hypothetical protein